MEEILGISDFKWEIEKLGFEVYKIGEERVVIQ
jgi:hypothetical protein